MNCPARRTGYGCKCDRCRRAAARYQNQLDMERARGYRRTTDITGTRRRLQALMAIGWTGELLAPRLGWTTGEAVTNLMKQRRQFCYTPTALRVERLYDQLWNVPGPSSQGRTRAARKGWLPPLWWDDDRIDDPSYDPRTDIIPDEMAPSREARRERLAEVARLTALNLSASEIARRLNLHTRQVTRDRHDVQQAS